MAKKQDTISIGFEEKIWKAADILRGSLDASQYKGVVLGLIFLKYISDRFDQKFQELQGDEYAGPEDKDEYTAENIFYVPAEARWNKISAAAHTPQIGVVIDEALIAIERENDRLKNVLPGNFARPELPKNKLGEVVDLFTNIEMHDAGEEKDLLGRAMNIACRSLPLRRERTLVSSIRLPALSAHWWRYWNLTRVESLTLAAVRAVCLCRVPSL